MYSFDPSRKTDITLLVNNASLYQHKAQCIVKPFTGSVLNSKYSNRIMLIYKKKVKCKKNNPM